MKTKAFIQYSNSKQVSWEHCIVEPHKVKSCPSVSENDTQTYAIKYLISMEGWPVNLEGFFTAPITKYFPPLLTGKTVFSMN